MQEYWKDLRGDDASLWEHEWNKHGTCISTLETRCYTDYIPQQEVVDYFNKTVELFQFLPSYEVCPSISFFFTFFRNFECHYASKGNIAIEN